MTAWLTVQPQGGMITRRARANLPANTFRSLMNTRLTNSGGALEQTPPFYTANTHSAGSYYDGGTQTEPATAKGSLLVGLVGSSLILSPLTSSHFMAGRYGAWFGTTQLQVIKQTSVPSGSTITKQCFVLINSYSGLGLNLGSTLEIEIDGATTFRWRKNAGAWTSLVAITTSGVSIDGGNATVYFQTATGFTVADAWIYTRTDWFYESTGTARTYDWSYAYDNGDIYFSDYYGRIMMYKNSGVQSVGYKPVYGTHVTIFEKHLVVGNYSASAFTTDSNVVGWSDLNDYQNFFARDVNEADTYTMPGGVLTNDCVPSVGVCGLWVENEVLFILTTNGIYRSGYYGLPVVFSIKFQQSCAALKSFSQPVASRKGTYILSADGILLYNGATLTKVSDDLEGLEPYYTATTRNLSSLYTSLSFGGYDSLREEVYFMQYNAGTSNTTPMGTGGFFVYQEATGTWYFRAADFTDGGPFTMATLVGAVTFPYSRCVLREDVNWSRGDQTFIKDYNSGASYAAPILETQDLVDEWPSIMETTEQFLDASYGSATGAYDTSAITVEVSTRAAHADTVTYNTALLWTSSATDGQLSGRYQGRIFRVRITATTSGATKLVRDFLFNLLSLNIINGRKPDVRR